MKNKITIRQDDTKRDYALDKPAPRIVRDEVEVQIPDDGRTRFSLLNVIGWVFNGQVHTPDGR